MKLSTRTRLRFFSACFFLWSLATTAWGQATPAFLDLRSTDLANTRTSLAGNWNFYPNQLITPSSSKTLPIGEQVLFPLLWNDDMLADQKINYATYSLSILVAKSDESLAIELPQMYSSYRLWINGNEVAHNGSVNDRAEQTRPQWLPQTVAFTAHRDTIQLLLQVANFHHAKGGAKDPLYLGGSDKMQTHRQIAVTSNLVEAIALILSGLTFLVVWYFEQKRVTLYFTLLCLTWAFRSVFSNLYLAIALSPDFDWALMVRIEYITLYLTMIWAILFLNRLFPAEGNLIIKYLLVGVNLLFLTVALFTAPLSFTRLLPIYLGFCAFLLGYGLYIILRAWINDHAGVWYLIFSVLVSIGVFAYDFFSYEGVFTYNAIVMGIGYIAIFVFTAISLLFHLNIIKSKSNTGTLTYNEMYDKQKL